jgi:CRP-like cAMP-binding protein
MPMFESKAEFGRTAAARQPLAKLFACPPEAEFLLSVSSERIACNAGDAVFRQNELPKGLYVVLSGDFMRTAVRMTARLTLGPVGTGEVVELAAALSDARHTCTLTALTGGSLLLLPLPALHRAFAIYPLLRMHLLEELAREVSRAYLACCTGPLSCRRRRVNPTVE